MGTLSLRWHLAETLQESDSWEVLCTHSYDTHTILWVLWSLLKIDIAFEKTPKSFFSPTTPFPMALTYPLLNFFILIFMYVLMFVSVLCTLFGCLVPTETKRKCQMPWKLSYRWLPRWLPYRCWEPNLDLCKSSKCPYPPSHLSSSYHWSFLAPTNMNKEYN